MSVQKEIKNEEFTSQQKKIMENATKTLNTIIQKQPLLKNHEVIITQENGKLTFKVDTTDGTQINEKEASTVILKAVLELKGNEFVVAGLALQQEKVDQKELEDVLKNNTSQQAIRNLLKRSTIGFTEQTNETKEGEGKSNGVTAYAFTRENRLAEEKRIKAQDFGSIKHIADNEEVRKELEKGTGFTAEKTGKVTTIRFKTDNKIGYLEITLKSEEEVQQFYNMYAAIKKGTTNFYKDLAKGEIKYDTKKAKIEEKDGIIQMTYSNVNTKGQDKIVILVNKDGTLNEQGHADFNHIFKNREKDGASKKDVQLREKALEYVKAEIKKSGLEEVYNNFEKQVKAAYKGALMTGITAGMCRAKEEIFSKEILNKITEQDQKQLTQTIENKINEKKITEKMFAPLILETLKDEGITVERINEVSNLLKSNFNELAGNKQSFTEKEKNEIYLKVWEKLIEKGVNYMEIVYTTNLIEYKEFPGKYTFNWSDISKQKELGSIEKLRDSFKKSKRI